MPFVWNVDAPVLSVVDQVVTAEVSDPDLIIASIGFRAKRVTVVVELDDGVTPPDVAGQTMLVRTRIP